MKITIVRLWSGIAVYADGTRILYSPESVGPAQCYSALGHEVEVIDRNGWCDSWEQQKELCGIPRDRNLSTDKTIPPASLANLMKWRNIEIRKLKMRHLEQARDEVARLEKELGSQSEINKFLDEIEADASCAPVPRVRQR